MRRMTPLLRSLVVLVVALAPAIFPMVALACNVGPNGG
jgi:hypothetical protein